MNGYLSDMDIWISMSIIFRYPDDLRNIVQQCANTTLAQFLPTCFLNSEQDNMFLAMSLDTYRIKDGEGIVCIKIKVKLIDKFTMNNFVGPLGIHS